MKKKYVAIILFCLLALMPTASAKDFYGYSVLSSFWTVMDSRLVTTSRCWA